MIDLVKEATSQERDSFIVHWLHAINPDLFTKQIVRYVQNKTKQKKTKKKPPIMPHIASQHTHRIENHMCTGLQLHSECFVTSSVNTTQMQVEKYRNKKKHSCR